MPPKPSSPKAPKKGAVEETKIKKKKQVVEEDEDEENIQQASEEEEEENDPEPPPIQRSRSMTSPNVIEGGSIDIAKKKKSLLGRLGFGSKKNIELKKAPALPPTPEPDVLNKMFAKLLVKWRKKKIN